MEEQKHFTVRINREAEAWLEALQRHMELASDEEVSKAVVVQRALKRLGRAMGIEVEPVKRLKKGGRRVRREPPGPVVPDVEIDLNLPLWEPPDLDEKMLQMGEDEDKVPWEVENE